MAKVENISNYTLYPAISFKNSLYLKTNKRVFSLTVTSQSSDSQHFLFPLSQFGQSTPHISRSFRGTPMETTQSGDEYRYLLEKSTFLYARGHIEPKGPTPLETSEEDCQTPRSSKEVYDNHRSSWPPGGVLHELI